MSLIELLVALALAGIVLIPAAALMLNAFTNESAYRQQNSTQQNARYALDLIADDMKGAERSVTLVTMGSINATMPTATVRGAAAATVSTPANITNSAPLYFNVFDDPGARRRVRYWLEGTNLRREIVSFVDETTTPGTPASATSGTVVARNVLTFTAQKPYDSQSTADPRLNNYNIVRVVIRTQESAGSQQSSVTLQSDVTLRNNLL